MADRIESDYVVIGAGATSMAFVDTLLSESTASVTMVDRRHRAGGHWNDAYPFVRLHSTSCFYGVNSAPLGQDRVDQIGLNRDHLELASGAEIQAYMDDVMRHRFLPSGRVTFLPMHDYQDGVATSRLSGKAVQVVARQKVVDGAFAQTEVPATHPPRFEVAPGTICIPPGGLVHLAQPAAEYVLIGGGKTAIDCALFLLEMGVEPEAILWVRPRDSWLINRRQLQPRLVTAEAALGGAVDEMEAAVESRSVDGFLLALEARDKLMRIDPDVWPGMYHCATVSVAEVEQLRRIKRVVRQGHVRRIAPGVMEMEGGRVATAAGAVHVNCTARGVPARGSEPIFQPGRIVLQFVAECWPCFSGALIAWLEAHRPDDAARNALAQPVPMSEVPLDRIRGHVLDEVNSAAWEGEADLVAWRNTARVESFSRFWGEAEATGRPELLDLMRRYEAAKAPGMARLTEILRAAAGG